MDLLWSQHLRDGNNSGRGEGAKSNRPLSAATIASTNTYLINIWPEDTLSVPKTLFSHSNEELHKRKTTTTTSRERQELDTAMILHTNVERICHWYLIWNIIYLVQSLIFTNVNENIQAFRLFIILSKEYIFVGLESRQAWMAKSKMAKLAEYTTLICMHE